MSEWESDCVKWRGKVLAGTYSHYCDEWDGLPIDETTMEWPCPCKPDIDRQIAEGRWGKRP